MQIVVTVNSYEELMDFARQLLSHETTAKAEFLKMEEVKEDIQKSLKEKAKEILHNAGPVPDMPKPEPVKDEAPFEEKEEPKTAEYTQTDVRKFLGELRKAGKKAEVTALINSLGFSKFTDVPEEKFPELMEKARAI